MSCSHLRATAVFAGACLILISCASRKPRAAAAPPPGSSSVVSVDKGPADPTEAALAEQEAREEEARRLAGFDPDDPLLNRDTAHAAGSEWGTRPAVWEPPTSPESGAILQPSTLSTSRGDPVAPLPPPIAATDNPRVPAPPTPEAGPPPRSTVIAIEKDPREVTPRSVPPPGPLAAAASLPGTSVVAIVRGQAITRDQLADAAVTWYGGQALDEIITRQLVQQEVDRIGLTTAPAELDARILKQVEMGRRELERQYGETVDLETFLRQNGDTLESYQAKLRSNTEFARQYTLEKLVAFSMLTEPRVEIQVIQTETEEQARSLLDKVSRGADFARVATEHSKDPVSASQGGRMRPFLRGMSRFGGEFDATAFSIPKDGGLAGPIRTNRGVFVIRRFARSEARTAVHYAEIADEVRAYLESPGVDAQDVLRWVQRLRADNTASIEVHLP